MRDIAQNITKGILFQLFPELLIKSIFIIPKAWYIVFKSVICSKIHSRVDSLRIHSYLQVISF